MRNALLSLRDADPVHFEIFLKQLLRDTYVVPPVFFQKKVTIQQAEALRRLGMSYLKILAEDDPQSLINRLEQAQKIDEQLPTTYAS